MGITGKQKVPPKRTQPQQSSTYLRPDFAKKSISITDNQNPNFLTPSSSFPLPNIQQQNQIHRHKQNCFKRQKLSVTGDASCSCSDTDADTRQHQYKKKHQFPTGAFHDCSETDAEAYENLGIEGDPEHEILHKSQVLTVEELLRRRSRKMKQLAKLYRQHYWTLMEGLRFKYREFYMKYGKSGWKNDEGEDHDMVADSKCLFPGCKSKPMALCSYCYNHILSDERQQLYKPCTYVVKSGQTGTITCGIPVLRAAVPSLCTSHFQKAEKHIARALKKAGLNAPSSSKPAPKFHILISEYVNFIQHKRREAKNVISVDHVIPEVTCNLNTSNGL